MPQPPVTAQKSFSELPQCLQACRCERKEAGHHIEKEPPSATRMLGIKAHFTGTEIAGDV